MLQLQVPEEILGFEDVVHVITNFLLSIHLDAGYDREHFGNRSSMAEYVYKKTCGSTATMFTMDSTFPMIPSTTN